MKVLGIETSCDETAVAIIDNNRQILSHQLISQIKKHSPYGGVVPEIAARNHIIFIDQLITESLKQANLTLNQIDAIGCTAGPGLIGGLLIGVMTAKAICSAANKPFIAVNHLEGHALTCRLTDNVDYPFMLLLVSGGHCQILYVQNLADYHLLGETIDDSVGEAFDKVAKMLNLGYPGGPIIEQKAKMGDEKRFAFPLSMIGKDHANFSFSGLKTAVRRIIEQIADNITEQDICDICASFQYTVSEILKDRLSKSFEMLNQSLHKLVIAGGVAANRYIYNKISELCSKYCIEVITPPLNLCTDNAAMIGWAAIERLSAGLVDDLSFEPKSNWPLIELNL